jgi:hypothetical protein
MDSHHFGKLDPAASKCKLDPDLHQGEKQDPDPDLHQSEKVEALEGHFGALEGLNLEKGVIGSGSVYNLQFFYLMIIYKKKVLFLYGTRMFSAMDPDPSLCVHIRIRIWFRIRPSSSKNSPNLDF